MVTSPLSSGEWPSPENTPPSDGKTYTQLEIISFFTYHSKKDIVRAVKEMGYGPSTTSLYRMFPPEKRFGGGVFNENEIKEILRGVNNTSEESDKAIEILSKSVLVPEEIREILRQMIPTTENQKETCRQQQQLQHQDNRCGMVPLISTTPLVELSPNEEDNESKIMPHARPDLSKPPNKCIGQHDTKLPPPQEPRRSARLKKKENQQTEVVTQLIQQPVPQKSKNRQVGVPGLFKAMGLTLITEEGDGNCLFRAIARQMSLILKEQFTHNQLRSECCSYIRENASSLKEFLDDDEQLEEYVYDMSHINVYGGDMEMSSLMKCYGFGVDIFTIQEDGSLNRYTLTPAPEFKVKFKVMLFHKNPSSESHCHYDSIVWSKDATEARKINVSVLRSSERTKEKKRKK